MVEPRIESCFHQIRWSAAGGLGPLVAPQTAILPAWAATSSEVRHVASPTCSTTTSAPLPPVSSLTRAFTSSRAWSIAASAPSSRARSSFASLDDVTITRAPSAFAIASAAVATVDTESGAVRAEDAGLRHRRHTLADPQVQMVERGGTQLDEHLAVARHRVGCFLVDEHVGTAIGMDTHRAHGRILS